jgi:hypothetical protein
MPLSAISNAYEPAKIVAQASSNRSVAPLQRIRFSCRPPEPPLARVAWRIKALVSRSPHRQAATHMQHHEQLPTSSPDIVVYAQGTTCCAVCALRSAGRSAVEKGIQFQGSKGHASWQALQAPFPDAAPNPRPCPHDGQRQHWLLVRLD